MLILLWAVGWSRWPPGSLKLEQFCDSIILRYLSSFQELTVQRLPNHRSVSEVNNPGWIFLPRLCLLNLYELSINYALCQSIGKFYYTLQGKKNTSIFLISLHFLLSSYDYRRGWMITLTHSIKLAVLLTFLIPLLHPTSHSSSGWRPVQLIIIRTEAVHWIISDFLLLAFYHCSATSVDQDYYFVRSEVKNISEHVSCPIRLPLWQ